MSVCLSVYLYMLFTGSLAFKGPVGAASDRQLNCTQLALTVRRCLLMVHILVPSVS